MSGEVIKFPERRNPFLVAGEELQRVYAWTCVCGSQLFVLTPDGPVCSVCGEMSSWELGAGDDEPDDEA
jgi:hypothetical protein